MSKKNSSNQRQIPAAALGPASKPPRPAAGGNPISEFFASKAVRETIESVAIAFVLAFLFRTFEAEAFVIPTGSMAHTLMGAHKDVVCQQCGYQHTTGASEGNVKDRGDVVATTCPMCRYINRFAPDDSNYRTYTGDRILVSKFIYDFQEPERWDVVVFKCPNNEKNNYIKRLVGLPNQTTRIRHGDLWFKDVKADAGKFAIARKPPDKIRAMLQEVHDTHYIPLVLGKDAEKWPQRWQPTVEGSWGQEDTAAKRGASAVAIPTFTTSGGAAGQPAWLRYHHFVPQASDWQELAAGRTVPKPREQLITDFYSYNAFIHSGSKSQSIWSREQYDTLEPLGLHWVGDLALECDLEIKSVAGTLLLDLVKAGRHYRCAIDVATGEATLSIIGIDGAPGSFSDDFGGSATPRVTGQTALRGPGKHRLMLANVDNQLQLWIDGTSVAFNSPSTYLANGDGPPAWNDEDDGDLAPAGIGSEGAALVVERLKVLRDMYYIADKSDAEVSGASDMLNDYNVANYDGDFRRLRGPIESEGVRKVLSDPRQSYLADPRGFAQLFASRRQVDFKLNKDQFFTCGDNSPQSQDARIWGDKHYVTRQFLIGKALFIYWPHAVGPIYAPNPFNGGRIGPITPNFKEMGFVR